jgi:hypothetical protein
MRRLFLTANGENRQALTPRELAFVEVLEAQGYASTYSRYGAYDDNFRAIDSSDAVVALVDHNWYAATCKAVEMTYALDGVGISTIIEHHTPVHTFIFWSDMPFELGYLQKNWIRHYDHLHYLPLDVQEAAKAIMTVIWPR